MSPTAFLQRSRRPGRGQGAQAGRRGDPGVAAPAAGRPALIGALLVAAVVVAADQLTKHLVAASIPLGGERRLLPGLALVDTRNQGVAFGLKVGGAAGVIVLVCVALAVLAVLFVRQARHPLVWLPIGLLFGGAVGNIADRVRQGAVTDFVKLPLGWPPFNLADTAITVGAVVLVALLAGRRAPARPDHQEPAWAEPVTGAERPGRA